MKLLHCARCGDVLGLSYAVRRCDCGLTSGKYLPDGDQVEVEGPCELYGLPNYLFVTGRAEAYRYPEANGKVHRVNSTRQPTRLNYARDERLAARNADIKRLSAGGVSYSKLATRFGVSKQRIEQIVNDPHAAMVRPQQEEDPREVAQIEDDGGPTTTGPLTGIA